MEIPLSLDNLIGWFVDLPLESKIELYNHWKNINILKFKVNYVKDE